MTFVKPVYRSGRIPQNVKRKPSLSSLFNEIMNSAIPEVINNEFVKNRPSTNVLETKNEFILELAIPGLTKKEVSINVEKDVLTISAKKEKNEETNEKEVVEKYVRREFNYANFKRTFQLPETINILEIKADFKNGILNVSLPKKEEAKDLGPKKIEIS